MTTVRTTARTWRVDSARSSAGFRVRNLGVRHVRGSVPLRSGTVVTGDEGEVLAVEAVLDATGVDTGNARRDRDLRGDGLLGVEQTPTWRFASDGVERDGEAWRVTGVLTVRRSCPVVLSVGPAVPRPDGGLRVRATTSLDRRDAGVVAPRVLIGCRIDVELDVVLLADR
jgi:polyisoprenoid-binding protein YceI